MELIYNEDIIAAKHKFVTIVTWPRVRIASPEDLAIFQVTDPGAEITNWVLQAEIPFGVIDALISTDVKRGQLLSLGINGKLRFCIVGQQRNVAQVLQDGRAGDLIKVYWL